MPPLIWSVYELAKTRRLDAISVIVVSSILFTLIATGMGGSARLIQVRDALVLAAVGLLFLATLAMKRPMIFYLARATMARNTTAGAERFEALWERPGIPQVFRALTWFWGIGLVLQTVLLCGLAWVWPISRYLLLSPFIQAGATGLMIVASLMYLKRKPGALAIIGQMAPPAGV